MERILDDEEKLIDAIISSLTGPDNRGDVNTGGRRTKKNSTRGRMGTGLTNQQSMPRDLREQTFIVEGESNQASRDISSN